MAQFECDVIVNAPPDRVFQAWSDFRNADQLVSGIEEIEVLTDGPIGVGTKFRETRLMHGKRATEEMEITEFQPGDRFVVECDSCGAHWRAEMKFVPEGSGTRVVNSMDAKPLGFLSKIMMLVMSPFMKGMMLKCIKQDMEDLKAHCENSAHPGAAPSPA